MKRDLDLSPPHELSHEMAVLGFLMMPCEPSVFARTEGLLKSEYFFNASTRVAVETAQAIGLSGGVITEHTLEAAMKARGHGDYIDGPDFFSNCKAEAIGIPDDALWYIGELKKLHLRRQLLDAAKNIVRISNSAEKEPDDMIGSAMEAVMSAGQDAELGKGVRSMGEIIDGGVREQIDAITGVGSSKVRYIPTGLASLDHYIRGFRKSGLYLISAPTSLGKSLFVQDRAVFLAENEYSSLLFVTEMADEDVVTRQVFMIADLDEYAVREDPSLTNAERLTSAMDYATVLPIRYQDSAELTIEKLEVTVHQEVRVGKPDVVIVDHFHELQTERKFTRADEPLEYIAGRLKIIARTYDIPVVCVVQQNRGDHRGNQNAALKGTSALEQKADVIIFFEAVSDDGQVFLTPDEARLRAGDQGYMRVKARITKVRTGGMTGIADLVMDWSIGGQFVNWMEWEPMNREKLQYNALMDIRRSVENR